MHGDLTAEESERYSRQIRIPEVGAEGQLKLKRASVLLIGTGALGSPAAMYLAAAGVGRIGLVDDDVVDVSNLQRQILHGESWRGRPKLESAVARLHEINPLVKIDCYPQRFTPENALEIARSYDVIIDGSDNFPTRFLTNDAAFFLKIPLIYGAIHRFDGQFAVFAPHLGGPCYRCLLPEMPPPGSVPSCQEAGVLGVLPGVIGSLQALEALKILLEIGGVPSEKLTLFHGLRGEFRRISLRRDPACRLCGERPEITSIKNQETLAIGACSATLCPMETITTQTLREKLAVGAEGLLIDVREPDEYAVANIPEARLIPLATLPDHLDELPRDCDLWIHCKSGGRSGRAVQFLLENGFTRVVNVEGGMDAWLKESPCQ
ncbi:MAG: molybdopterin-synthase adenylyltransferase MoeB [Verrucomicrobia bacterium]|nr:MAG: molybdopterin-synthase adenylyltransferase MoeB [Verrucomicrobiota bacterium]